MGHAWSGRIVFVRQDDGGLSERGSWSNDIGLEHMSHGQCVIGSSQKQGPCARYNHYNSRPLHKKHSRAIYERIVFCFRPQSLLNRIHRWSKQNYRSCGPASGVCCRRHPQRQVEGLSKTRVDSSIPLNLLYLPWKGKYHKQPGRYWSKWLQQNSDLRSQFNMAPPNKLLLTTTNATMQVY